MKSDPEMTDGIRRLKTDIFREMERRLIRYISIVQADDIKFDTNLQTYLISGTKLHDGEKIDNIRLSGPKLGNLKGIIAYPNANDLGLVVDMYGERFWLGNVFDIYSTTKDQILKIKDGMLIQSQENGSFVLLSKNNNVYVLTPNGAKLALNNNSSIQLLNNAGYGFECDSSGNITIRGVTVNHTQTPGTFNTIN